MKKIFLLLALPLFAFATDAQPPRFTHAEKNFERVKHMLLERYYKTGISEDDLYAAATQGMLNYVDPEMSQWNKLITPSEYKTMHDDMSGKTTGIGIEVSFEPESGVVDVKSVIAGGPGEHAGLQKGDKILAINGVTYRNKTLGDVVAAIRGAEGSSVELAVLRDASVMTKKLTRKTIAWDAVTQRILPKAVGYVRIRQFTETTPQLLEKALIDLSQKKMARLVVDLRGNEGGLLDSAIACADAFLPKNALIVEAHLRGNQQKEYRAQREALMPHVPLAVLINKETKSGAEILAAALKFDAGATVVGEASFGKWSAQTVEKLPNDYAVKFTVMSFVAPNKQNFSGKGVSPDIPVALSADDWRRAQNTDKIEDDAQLTAALNILSLHE